MRRLAVDRGKSEIDPAKYDGTMTLGTIIALVNTVHVLGTEVHPVVGDAVDVLALIKKPIGLIPYGDQVLDIILSPWIIDSAFGVILDIIGIIPGTGSAAESIDAAMATVKSTIATAAPLIAVALSVVPRTSPSNGLGATPVERRGLTFYDPRVDGPLLIGRGLGDCTTPSTTIGPNPPPGFTWVAASGNIPGHWERLRVGQTVGVPNPDGAGTVTVRNHPTCLPNCTPFIPMPTVSTGFPPGAIVTDHRAWPKGKKINPREWSANNQFNGLAHADNLHKDDLNRWADAANVREVNGTRPTPAPKGEVTVRSGSIAFWTFTGSDGSNMGAFWDMTTETLKIKKVKKESSDDGSWYDFASDAVDAVVGAAEAVGSAAEDIVKDAWNWIADNVAEIYHTIKKYGCALINSDIVVAVAAAGTGIVATPAASAAVVVSAAEGRAACAALDVAELVYVIVKFLATDFPKPPSLTSKPLPPGIAAIRADMIAALPTMMSMATAADAVTNCEPPPPVSGQVLLPLSPPVVPLATGSIIYPPGAIAAFDPKIHRFRIAIRFGTTLSGFGTDATHEIVPRTTTTAPSGVPEVTLTQFQTATGTLPLFKKPVFWIVIGVGAIAVGGGGYVLYRRRRRLTR